MKGIVITTDNKVEVQTFGEPLYQTIGKAVGGYIEVVHPKGLPEPFIMIVNEEGLLQQLPPNLSAVCSTAPTSTEAPLLEIS